MTSQMTANILRRKFIDFFAKNYEHKEICGASLIPENDPTVLFTTAGMHPLVPYLIGQPHPSGNRLVDVQKCIRTDDIDEVGDECHLTFFEMLGNWSLGDYFKDLAIKMSFEFLTNAEKGLGLPLPSLAFSCFAGDNDAPRDDEAANIWRSLGVSEDRIAFLPKKNNWWGPAGQTGPCGPDTEMFYWTGEGETPKKFDPDNVKWVEIWNDVFMQYNKTADGKYEPLEQQNVDTGMGLERVLTVITGEKSPFDTELFTPVMEEINKLKTSGSIVYERIIADHLRASTFILGDRNGVSPSNTDQGYILRRLIRRAVRYGKKIGIENKFIVKIAEKFIKIYGDFYTELTENREKILVEFSLEEEKFNQTINKGLTILLKNIESMGQQGIAKNPRSLPEEFFFEMFATYGFPLELTLEELQEKGWINNEEEKKYVVEKFNEHFKKHQELSKAGAEKKFSGGLADHSEQVSKLHTATHLLHAALRQVLGNHVEQRGSNITPERLRFDFSHPDKMTPEQIKKVEEIVNAEIQKALPISCEETSVAEAKAKGAMGLFESKYGEKVKVYTMGGPSKNTVFSMEICGGPHANNTADLKSFKILKEESSSGGVRRIKAIIG
ncbi:MAG: alanine--tRNA ligase [Candidatus Gracilibacteria bacterium]|jgi:alanyl-tRNA synthetase